MAQLQYFFVLSILLAIVSSSFNALLIVTAQVGVCYGQSGNNLPTPSKSVQFIKKLNATSVKIYDADPNILNALKDTNLTVSIMVKNEILANISSNQNISDQWVRTTVLPFYPQTKITTILVGNEILSSWNKQYWFYLVPAMKAIYQSLKNFHLRSGIKVSTPLSMDCLESSVSWPSNGTFRADISKVLKPLVHFLNSSKAPFFVDIYPYFDWVLKPESISLDYALLSAQNASFKDPVSGLVYTNIIDQMLDSLIFAMKKLGYPNVSFSIAETGWPSGGDYDNIGASIYNAATYNRNLVKKFTAKPPSGTPARPGVTIPVNIFALYNENQKPGPGIERHFGLLYPNGTSIYDIDFSGRTPDWTYNPLPLPTNNEPFKGKLWCVVSKAAKWSQLQSAVDAICGMNYSTCASIQPGGSCYKPNWFLLHASYAFSSFWARYRNNGTTCFFNGLAVETTKDPSYLSCQFPSVNL